MKIVITEFLVYILHRDYDVFYPTLENTVYLGDNFFLQ